MKRRLSYTLIVVTTVLAMLLQPWQPVIRSRLFAAVLARHLDNLALPPLAGNSIYLPAVMTPPGPPVFAITSPGEGWTLSGMLLFAAQPSDPGTVSSVSFAAGGTPLGTDSTPEDGYRVFLDTGQFAAGPLQLTATATGPGGQASQSVMVTVNPDPPSSAVVGATGGVLASEIGSTITIPPGAVANGTIISVDELGQAEVTAQNGIEWDALGVTFLGAQDVAASAPIDLPLGVASAGFGNRVQPGQAVVNYTITPDADGDGVDELVVVNTASVAPNNDVVSDPVPQVLLGDTTTTSSVHGVTTRSLDNGISGPPGTLIEIRAEGFNPYSARGNLAIFESLVDGTTLELPGSVDRDLDAPYNEVFSVIMPYLPAGPAQLTLRNESTGSEVGPMAITVEAPVPINRPAEEIIDDFFAESLALLEALQNSGGQELEPVDEMIEQMTQARLAYQQLSADPAPEVQQYLQESATMIENSGLLDELAPAGPDSLARGNSCRPKNDIRLMKGLLVLSEVLFVVGCGLVGIAGFGVAGVLCAAGGVLLVESLKLWVEEGIEVCEEPERRPPRPCPLTSGGSGGGTTGMGSALPTGGPVCGNTIPAPDDNGPGRQRAGALGLEPGRYVVRLQSSNPSFISPFSGLADRGGYFFIPLVPANEPFTAVAYDTETGDCRTATGVGSPVSESGLLTFDFSSGACLLNEVRWDGGGDGVSWGDPLNWDTDTLPGLQDQVIIDVPGQVTVTHFIPYGAVNEIASLHSEENIEITQGTLSLATASVISGTLTLRAEGAGSATLDGTGDLMVHGPINLGSNGVMQGTGKTVANGGLAASGGHLRGRSLDNAATATVNGGYAGLSCSPCVFTNLPGAVFELQDGDFVGLNADIGGIFYNEGQFIQSGAVSTMGVPFVNRGRVRMQEGGVYYVYFSQGYTQEAAGTMVVEIGGPGFTDFDRYRINGDVILDGALEIVLLNNYEPEIGDTFEIIDDYYLESLTGQFATVEGLAIGNGKRFQVIYNPTSVLLEVVPDP